MIYLPSCLLISNNHRITTLEHNAFIKMLWNLLASLTFAWASLFLHNSARLF